MSQSANAENGTGADFASCIREYRKKLQTLDGDINVTEIKSLTDDVIHFKQKMCIRDRGVIGFPILS